jgi:hypothetical protein
VIFRIPEVTQTYFYIMEIQKSDSNSQGFDVHSWEGNRNMTVDDKQLINDILRVTEMHNSMSHEQQLYRLREITITETYPLQKVQEILNIKYSTAQAYFKKAKQSKAGNWMGNKMPLEYICKLCLHYGKSLEWFLESEG